MWLSQSYGFNYEPTVVGSIDENVKEHNPEINYKETNIAVIRQIFRTADLDLCLK